MTSSKQYCVICADHLTAVIRKELQCEYCEFKACVRCVEQYLLTQNSPCCMNTECKRPWTRKFLRKNLTGVFIDKRYRDHCTEIIYKNELAMLPLSQAQAEEIRERQREREENKKKQLVCVSLSEQLNTYTIPIHINVKKLSNMRDTLNLKKKKEKPMPRKLKQFVIALIIKIDKCANFLRTLEGRRYLQVSTIECSKIVNYFDFVSPNGITDEYFESLKPKETNGENLTDIQKYINQCFDVIKNEIMPNVIEIVAEYLPIVTELQNLHNSMFQLRHTQTKTKVVLTRRCQSAGCLGFLNEAWHCGLCNMHTCRRCNVAKETPNPLNEDDVEEETKHVCNPDDIESMKLIKKESKPCPSCGMGIFKIDGCSQMWCTQCHVAFDWNTMAIQKNIHNPHYFAWLRETNNGVAPRNPLDVRENACGGANDPEYDLTQLLDVVRMRMIAYTNEDAIKRLYGIPQDGMYIQRVSAIREIDKYRERLLSLIRSSRHNQQYQTRLPTQENANNQERVNLLLNDIEEQEFKRRITENMINFERQTEEYYCETLYTTVCRDIIAELISDLNTFMNDPTTKICKVKNTTINSFDQYCEYYDNEFIKLCEIFENTYAKLNKLIDYVMECSFEIQNTYRSPRMIMIHNNSTVYIYSYRWYELTRSSIRELPIIMDNHEKYPILNNKMRKVLNIPPPPKKIVNVVVTIN